jgi:hypothetical protein
MQKSNALTQLLQANRDKPEEEVIGAVRGAGFVNEAAGMEKDFLSRQGQRADLKKKGAEAEKTEVEAQGLALKQYRDALAGVNSPDMARQWLQAQYQDPRVKDMLTRLAPPDQALSQIPTDPAQFMQWRDQQAMGIEKVQEAMAARARDAETVRANQAREGLTRRGQDVGAATQRRGQDMADRRAGQTMEAEAGGPGQMELVRQFGRPPKDHRWKPDGSAEPIPGGPADIKAGAEGEKRAQRKQVLSAAAQGVVSTIKEARDLVGVSTAGVGGLLSALPATDARNLAAKLETIKANLGFDRLQQMRDMSPTGGALGAVAVQELTALQSTVASLDQKQSPSELRAALDKIEGHYNRWLKAIEGAGDTPAAPANEGKVRRYNPATGKIE